MMDKELPARIWVPILAACALIPGIILLDEAPRVLSGIIALGTLGLTVYLATGVVKRIKNDNNFTDKCVTGAQGFGVFMVLMVGVSISGAIMPPPTPEELAAQEQAAQARAAQAQAAQADACPNGRGWADCFCAHNPTDALCQPIMSDEAWSQFQGEATESQEADDAAQETLRRAEGDVQSAEEAAKRTCHDAGGVYDDARGCGGY